MNKILIAGAGAGKTTHLVKKAMALTPSPVLITTFTEANENSIKEMFYALNGCIPSNVTIMTWFSFLIAHGIKPYQSYLIKKNIKGISLSQDIESEIRFYSNNDEKKYISEDGFLYTVSLSKGVCTIDDKSGGAIFRRLDKIFKYIFIDEAQDLAGFDLEIVLRLSKLTCSLLLVGDPRQTTYQTHYEQKNKKYNNGKLLTYIQDKKLKFDIDCVSLSETFRCHPQIIRLANSLYPEYPQVTSNVSVSTGHDGIFWINENQIVDYIKSYDPVVLRNSKSTAVPACASKINNFGNSKGLTYDRTLIIPTKPILDWFIGKEMKPAALAKFYVAVTRARYSVGIVYKGLLPPSSEFGKDWNPSFS